MAVLTIVLVAVSLGTLTARHHRALVAGHERLELRSGARRTSCKAAPRSSGRARSCCRPSSAATATRSATKAARRGPALDDVAMRLTRDQLIRQVLQGGGNMPAYGKNLSPAETTALVAFLETLRSQGPAPRARPRSRRPSRGAAASVSSR